MLRRKNKSTQSPDHHDGDSARNGHIHGTVDPAIFSSARGIWATKASLIALLATAAVQTGVVVPTGSVALLADTVHNFGDAATAIPLWFAFSLARRQPTKRFSYGYGKAEDLAGLFPASTIRGRIQNLKIRSERPIFKEANACPWTGRKSSTWQPWPA